MTFILKIGNETFLKILDIQLGEIDA